MHGSFLQKISTYYLILTPYHFILAPHAIAFTI